MFWANLGKSVSVTAGVNRGLWCEKFGMLWVIWKVWSWYERQNWMAESVEVGVCWQVSNCTNDHRGNKCRQRRCGEDLDWKFWNYKGFSRGGAKNLVLCPETNYMFLSLILWLKETTFSVEFLWMVNHCIKYDPEMKHQTSNGLHHTSALSRYGSQTLLRWF